MRVILDANAIIFLNDFRKFDEIFTVSEVVDEIKDKISSMKLSVLKLNVLEPSKQSIKEIKLQAGKTGDIKKLSITDIKLLALAKEMNLVIVSDDYAIQNVAEKLKINYIPASMKKIKQLVTWKNYCNSCRKFRGNEKTCPVCGSELIRKPDKLKLINRQSFK